MVLQCFGQIQRADGVLTRQVGDGARSDSSPWHRALRARERAQELGFQLIPLPGYSPDLNPIEGLWKWLREEVTQHHSYQTMRDLFMACKDFIDRINLNPEALVQRLSPKFDLDPKFEKLLFS